MAQLQLKYPPKSEENRKTANVCEQCRRKGWSAELAASKLKDGIIHLTIDQLDDAHRNGNQVTPEEVERFWEALVAGACEDGCGCAQVLLQHIHCNELNEFWAATVIDHAEGKQLSRREKKYINKISQAQAMQLNTPLAPLGKHHAGNRRLKKNKARAKRAALPAPNASNPQTSLPGPADTDQLSSGAFGTLQQALPTVLPAAPPANPVQTVLGLPVTFVATLATHVKPTKK